MKTLFVAILLVLGSASAGAKETSPSVEADQALAWLKNGNVRFAKSLLRKDGQSQKDVKRLASGQRPHAIVLSCSDSRVPPEIVFDQKLGDIFTVRTAGEALADNAIGSIEYAVEHFGSKLILVMGHTGCGAVQAALDTLDGQDAGTPALNGLVKDLHPHLVSFKGHPRSENIAAEGWANTEGVAADLISRSALLKEKLAKGEIKIQSALYDLDTGVVGFDKAPGTPVKK